jgi:hypothetical protein
MIPVRRNIDTDELVLWLDPDSPLSSSINYNAYSIGRRGKNLLAGTSAFTNAVPPCISGYYGPDTITPNNATVAMSATPAPDGTVNKTYDLVESSDGSNKSHFLRYDYGLTPPISGGPYEIYTFSLYVKVSTGGRTIRIQNSNTPNSGALTVDPATGTIIASDADNIDEGVEALPGGWYRIYYTVQISDAFSVETNTRLAIYLADASGNTSYQGDGTSSVLIYGNQFEKGTISNYTPGPEGEDFSIYTNKKMKAGTNENPGYYRTSFAGNNLRFNGVESALGVSINVRSPFRPGIHPNGSNDKWSLLSHTLFAWVNLDPHVDPQEGTTGTGVIATVIGMIGGKANNGVFGLNKEGTKILYKTRVRDTGGTQSFTNESSAFPTVYDTWAFIALSFNTAYGSNTATVDFYLNGQFLNTVFAFNLPTRTVRGIDGSGSGLTVGQFIAGGSARGLFKGLINICGTYNKALNAAEHEALYNATKYRFHNN